MSASVCLLAWLMLYTVTKTPAYIGGFLFSTDVCDGAKTLIGSAPYSGLLAARGEYCPNYEQSLKK
jgi:hypothetical protein